MKQSMTKHDVAQALCGDPNANWSRAGAEALAEHLEELEDATGWEVEFDRVAIRCDWAEYESLIDWAMDYFGSPAGACDAIGIDSLDETDDADDAIRAYIEDRGTVLEFDGGVIVSSF